MKIGLALAAIALLGAAAFTLSARHAALKALDEERERKDSSAVSVNVRDIGPLDRSKREGWKILATGREIRDIAWFENRLWAATSGGLLSISPDGRNSILYTRLNGLPDADITCLAVSEGKLYVGTGAGALLIVKGGRLSQVSAPDQPLGRITALLPMAIGVIIGTGESGAWRFDGRAISDIGKGRAGGNFKKITALYRHGDRLVIGAFDDGLYIEEPAGYSHFTTAQGLPMNQITAVGDIGGELLVGAPMGWARIDVGGSIKSQAGPFITSITTFKNSTWAASGDGVMVIGPKGVESRALSGTRITVVKPAGDALYAGTDNGILKYDNGTWAPFYTPGTNEIAGNHITALLTQNGELWAGTFENGFDILDASRAVKSHPEDDSAWAVNAFLGDGDQVWVAHNEGVSVYRGDMIVKQITQKDGLIGRRVSAVCAVPGGRAYATEAGLTLDAGGVMAGIYAFHGLPNNHVYACATIGDKTYAGTLGGLGLINGEKVIRSWRPGESPLKTGWITALAVSGSAIFIGTYGGGAQKLEAPDAWTDYSDATGGFEVNPGAMLVAGDSLLVGSLDRGLFVMELAGGKWRNITDGLASIDVTALAADSSYYYVGTERGITIIPRRDIDGYNR